MSLVKRQRHDHEKDRKMSELQVRIVELEPMRVASFYGFGPSPEDIAWGKLVTWAKPRGFLGDPQSHRIFGFNNPNPSPGSPNYGYEFWIVVGPDVEPEGDIAIKEFGGGMYAVAQSRGLEEIGPVWKSLVLWREDSKYGCGSHQWLEEHVGADEQSPEEITLDLHLPIAE
jgi:DNA gyrase inhibitor GyrI